MDLNIFKKEKVLVPILMVLSFVLFFYKLGAPSLFETDEVIYTQVAREIVRSGDWITLHLFGHNWFIHPPFYMWLTALSSYVFGVNEFNTRLWSALFAMGLVYVTYLLGKKMYKDGTGIIAGFIIAATLQYILQARMAIFDIPLVFFEMLALLFYFYWQEDKLQRYYYLFFLSMGLAVFMKGPIGILLPLLVLTPFLLVTGRLTVLFNLKFLPGLIITYLVGGTWYTAEVMIHGKTFVDSVFGFYLIGRYLTTIEQHYGPWYFYVPVLIIGFIPWISFLPYSISNQWKKRGDGYNLFSMLWMAIVFLFFSIAGTKLPGYLMPFYPIAAISVAKMLQDNFSGEDSGLPTLVSRAYKTLAIFSIGLLVVAALLKVFEFPDMYDRILANVVAMLIIVGIGGIISSLWFFKRRDSAAPIAVLVVTMLVFSMYTASYTMKTLDYFKPMKAISQKINSQYAGNETIIGYKVLNKGSFMFYLDKPVIWIGNIFDLREQLKHPGKILLITNAKDFMSLGQDDGGTLFLVYSAGDMVLLSNQK
jgi:4-amino-4-deoxy-L-arabinose transferase-like glycosyltransferase